MRAYGVSLAELEEVGRSFSNNSVGSVIRDYGNEYALRGMARTTDLEALGNSLVKTVNGKPIVLSDVADVTIGHALRMGNASQNAKPSVILSVSKQPNINTLKVTEQIEANLNDIKKSLPSDVRMDTKRLLVSNGQYVEAGQPIASVAQNRNLFIRAEIPSRYYSLLGNIETANIRLLNDKSVYSLSDVGGTMVSYGKSVDANNPLLPVVFKVNNTIDLLPGSFVEMYIKTRNTQPAITVPSISIVEEMGNYFVYVQLTPEFFEKREVRIGQTDGKRTEIVSGLKEGERVVGKGAILVKLAQASGTLDAHSGHVH